MYCLQYMHYLDYLEFTLFTVAGLTVGSMFNAGFVFQPVVKVLSLSFNRLIESVAGIIAGIRPRKLVICGGWVYPQRCGGRSGNSPSEMNSILPLVGTPQVPPDI